MREFTELLFGTYLVFFIFFLVGLVELIVIYFILRTRKNRDATWYETKANVVEVQTGRGSKGGTIYYPIFQFKTHMGEVIRQKSGMGSNPSYYNQGMEVDLYYHPEKHNRMMIKNDKRIRLMFIIFGVVATIFFLVGLGGLIFLAGKTGMLQ